MDRLDEARGGVSITSRVEPYKVASALILFSCFLCLCICESDTSGMFS